MYILRNLISFVLFVIYYSQNVEIVLIFYIFVGLYSFSMFWKYFLPTLDFGYIFCHLG